MEGSDSDREQNSQTVKEKARSSASSSRTLRESSGRLSFSF